MSMKTVKKTPAADKKTPAADKNSSQVMVKKGDRFLNDTGENRRLYGDSVWHSWKTSGDPQGGSYKSFIDKWKQTFKNTEERPKSYDEKNGSWEDYKATLFYGNVAEVDCPRCKDIPICCAEGCNNFGTHGAHVYDKSMKTSHSPNDCLIVATCTVHNPAPPFSVDINKNHPNLHYPRKMDAIQADVESYRRGTDGQEPGEIQLTNGNKCKGMKVKRNTFAVFHNITVEIDDDEIRNELCGKGRGKGNSGTQGRKGK